jgi:ADP-ribose pyrophosphatase YjhB (NUDIX family)
MKDWFHYITELQEIAQIGLTYTKDPFDVERFERLRKISVEMMAKLTDSDVEIIKNVFANDSGYQTPKVDIRGILLNENKILLVKEQNGLWSLPGGWADIGRSLFENVEKEFMEEAFIKVKAQRLLAVQNKIPMPQVYPHTIYTHYVACTLEEIETFEVNNETTERDYFSIDALPPLDENKTAPSIIQAIVNRENEEVIIF